MTPRFDLEYVVRWPLYRPTPSARRRRSAGEQALRDWYRSKPDAGTHSAAGFALGQWKLALPPITPTTRPEAGAHWYVNSIGMTMVLIPAGEFLMGSPDSDKDAGSNEKPQHRGADHEAVLAGHAQRSQWGSSASLSRRASMMRARTGRTRFPRRPTIIRWSCELG